MFEDNDDQDSKPKSYNLSFLNNPWDKKYYVSYDDLIAMLQDMADKINSFDDTEKMAYNDIKSMIEGSYQTLKGEEYIREFEAERNLAKISEKIEEQSEKLYGYTRNPISLSDSTVIDLENPFEGYYSATYYFSYDPGKDSFPLNKITETSIENNGQGILEELKKNPEYEDLIEEGNEDD